MASSYAENTTQSAIQRRESLYGTLAGFIAFFIWGSLVLYWKALDTVDALDVVAHRIVWSCVIIVPIGYLMGNFSEVRTTFASKNVLFKLLCSAAVLTLNWLLYIWAVSNDHVVEASLGYFINPLVYVFLGYLFLKERLTRLQALAVSIAFAGVLWSVVAYGHMPWLALGLACSFAIYGYMHKIVSVSPVTSLCAETLLLAPFALIWLLYQWFSGQENFFDYETTVQLLLMGTGIITTIPLFLFGWASQHVSLASLGLLQYVAPTFKLVLGTVLYGEPVNAATGVTLCCIWIGLALYTWCNFTQMRATHKIHRRK